MRNDQWRRQRGADGARALPFVLYQFQLSRDLSMYSALYTACIVTRMMSEMWAGPSNAHADCLGPFFSVMLWPCSTDLSPALPQILATPLITTY